MITFMVLFSISMMGQTFKREQQGYTRVREAYSEKEAIVKKMLADKKIDNMNIDVFLRVFKQEKIIEVWAKKKSDLSYTFITNYQHCSSSGELGPKRKQGDMQTPEGFYYIDRFNPFSNFYLSLGVNYPNQSDRILGEKNNLGGDIFIHGSCVTIGCIPITDDKIKELYIFAVEAKNAGQSKIPVYIFPTKDFETLLKNNSSNEQLIAFWNNLKIGYDYFEKEHKLPTVSVNVDGKYIFK
ncbi:MAG: hypothetical protein A2W98_06815 [Bacteroidetes bacterium GWF2_33_38]|nr:MAG: hypothetical protein A2W98_06815 [Bacteroidetes bacterium GWF2_33_38]OFY89369.1 MAG: hypothetical protein A2236_05365 [Bacteroidetes bacterium RIFOXYA2_FULL_33_7]